MSTVTVTTPRPTQLVITRDFDAPPERVFDALTKPELLRRWHGARGWHLVVCEVDLRVGGVWRFVSRGPDGAEIGHGGVYQEIDAPRRLAYTERYDDQWFQGDSLVTATLTGRTTLTTAITFVSQQVRDLVLRSPMERGVTQSYDRLDGVLAELAPTRKDNA